MMEALTSMGSAIKAGISSSSSGGDTYLAKMCNGMNYPIRQEEWSIKSDYYLDTFVYYMPEIITNLQDSGNPIKRVLEMGVARGVLSIGIALLTDADTRLVGIDIEEKAHALVTENAQINNVVDKMEVRIGDLFTPVKAGESFDLIFGEMPFIPVPPEKQRQYISEGYASEILNISGGNDGRCFIDAIISQGSSLLNPGGAIVLIQPSFVGIERTNELFAEYGLSSSVLVSREWKLNDTKFTRSMKEHIEATTGYHFPQNDDGEDIFYLTIMKGVKQ